MSLTSYRAAPSRATNDKRATFWVALFLTVNGFMIRYMRALQCLATPYSSSA